MPLRASEYTGDLRDAVSHLTEARRLGGEKLSTPAAPRRYTPQQQYVARERGSNCCWATKPITEPWNVASCMARHRQSSLSYICGGP